MPWGWPPKIGQTTCLTGIPACNCVKPLDALSLSFAEGDAMPSIILDCDVAARGVYPSNDILAVGRFQMRGA